MRRRPRQKRALAVARAGIQAAMDRRDELEGKIANYRTMQDQRRQRLEWVRGAKEASTLMAELDLARFRAGQGGSRVHALRRTP